MAKMKVKEKIEEVEEDPVAIEEAGEIRLKKTKFKTARGRTTRYSCLYSTVPSKRNSPPTV